MNNVESASAAGDEYRSAQDPARRRHRRDGRRGARQPVPAGGLYRPSGLESRSAGAIGYSLATGVVHRRRLLPRADGAAAGGRAAGRDPADPAVYRPGDRRAGVRGDADAPCAGGHPGAAAQHRRLGAEPGGRRAGAAGTSAAAGRHATSWRRNGVVYHGHAAVRRRRHAGRADPGRDRGVHHRPPVRSGRALRAASARCWRSSASSTARRWASAIRPPVALGYLLLAADLLRPDAPSRGGRPGRLRRMRFRRQNLPNEADRGGARGARMPTARTTTLRSGSTACRMRRCWSAPGCWRPKGRRVARCGACRSRSRTISTLRGCRRRRPVRGIARVAEATAPAVQRLLDAGAVLVGKTNLDQFATGLVGDAQSLWDSAQCVRCGR